MCVLCCVPPVWWTVLLKGWRLSSIPSSWSRRILVCQSEDHLEDSGRCSFPLSLTCAVLRRAFTLDWGVRPRVKPRVCQHLVSLHPDLGLLSRAEKVSVSCVKGELRLRQSAARSALPMQEAPGPPRRAVWTGALGRVPGPLVLSRWQRFLCGDVCPLLPEAL